MCFFTIDLTLKRIIDIISFVKGMFSLIRWVTFFLKKKRNKKIPPMPSREEFVDIMYDKQLLTDRAEILRVIYSTNREFRYIIYKSKKALLYYELERLSRPDEFEWELICKEENALPGYWEPAGSDFKSFFNDIDELMKDLKSEPEYKLYFI